MASRLLLIDDDPKLHRLLTDYLTRHDFEVVGAYDGPSGLQVLEQGQVDMVLLDLSLPRMDGLEVCRRIRSKSGIPIVMLTARGDETDRVVGLEMGADDYLPKPFGPRELLARIRAVLRRSQGVVSEQRLKVGGLELDHARRSASWKGHQLELTGLEYDLLGALAERAGRVVARDTLLSAAGRTDVVVGARTVDVHISHLRQKLQAAGGSQPIRTVRGVGYLLAEEA